MKEKSAMKKTTLFGLMVLVLLLFAVQTPVSASTNPPWWPTPEPEDDGLGGYVEPTQTIAPEPIRDMYCVRDETNPADEYCFDRNKHLPITVKVLIFNAKKNILEPAVSAGVQFRYLREPRDPRTNSGTILDACTTGIDGACTMSLPVTTGTFQVSGVSFNGIGNIDKTGFGEFLDYVAQKPQIDFFEFDDEYPYAITTSKDRNYYIILYPNTNGQELKWALYQQNVGEENAIVGHMNTVYGLTPENLPLSLSPEMVNNQAPLEYYYPPNADRDYIPPEDDTESWARYTDNYGEYVDDYAPGNTQSDSAPQQTAPRQKVSFIVVFLVLLLIVGLIIGGYLVYSLLRKK